MNPIQLFDAPSSTYTYILFDNVSREAVVIDPVDTQLERDQAVLVEYGLTLRWALVTHAHADHFTSAGQLAEHHGAKTAAPAGGGITTAAVQLQNGDVLAFGSERLTALHTPGHTAGSMCYLWRGHLLTGDTLLINGCGRTDVQSGSADASHTSLPQMLFALPESTTVWPGHDDQGRHFSTIGHEKANNARVAGKARQALMDTVHALKLPLPQRLDEVLPLNLMSGLRHDADADAVQLMQVQPAKGYAGDVSLQLAYQWFLSGEAVLVDVRSDAEREWVGFVTGAVPIAWKQWPGMGLNTAFEADLAAAVPEGGKVVLLCRSGVRSIAAARHATEKLGLQAYNILEGFEGDPDVRAHRGNQGGWRFHGLPWRQK